MRGVFKVAKVAISCAAYYFDNEYSYCIPEHLFNEVEVGVRVIVPFGRGNKKSIGLVTRTYEQSLKDAALKPIISVVDPQSLVTPEMLRIIFWLKENTFCTFFDAYKAAVPSGFSYRFDLHYTLANTYIDESTLSQDELRVVSFIRSSSNQREIDKYLSLAPGDKNKKTVESLIDKGYIERSDLLKRRVGDENVKMVRLSRDYLEGNINITLTQKQSLVVRFLEESVSAGKNEVCYMTNCTNAIIKRLVDKNVLQEYSCELMRNAIGEVKKSLEPEDITLNEQQQNAFNGISRLIADGKPAGALLYGVTGSGKTEVFIKLIDLVTKQGKTAVMLVPEISLTPQLLNRFKSYFGNMIAIVHSSLSLGQRIDEFKRIKSGEARIVIGTRSAVFAPACNVGIIIMDEEGEPSYKSESNPRYHARDVAIQRCGHNNCVLLMASATPSIESYYFAKNNRFHLFTISRRYSNAKLPQVRIIDMQNEVLSGNDSLISRELCEGIRNNLERSEQSILLLNRRGFNTFVSCASCRQPVVCPNCNLALTYHKKNGMLMCHYCGYTMPMTTVCPSCGSEMLRASGVGTQRVENEIARLFPEARVLRMDSDTTSSRYAYEEKFKAFENGEYDIMLGTQMIAKGLDFPNVTLVGVISLDKSLFTGDFRSYERTFSLLTQVVGRSGRGEKSGVAYIQTFVPEHYVIELAAKQDYNGFYEQEIALRQTLIYPPICDLCVIGFSSMALKDCTESAKWVTELLSEYIKNNKVNFPMRAVGPIPCTLEMINNRYRYRLILKTKNCKEFRDMIRYALNEFYKNKTFKNVRIYADINGDIGL